MTAAVRAYDAARDAAALRALIVEHQDFHRGLESSWPPGASIIDQYVAYLEKQCTKNSGRILVADVAGHLVGFLCVVTSARNDSPDDPARFAWVHDVFVAPSHRRQGIGAALLDRAEAFVREGGARELRLGVLERNENARAIYRARGFRDYLRILTKPLD